MQWPRRTSEFQEETETATKRQSKIPGRFTNSVGVTPIVKYGTRSITSATGSAQRGRTPMQTPKSSARALFSAEKKRNVTGVNLHNDKKWIQDQTHRIGEYLKNAFERGELNGLTEDFFNRPNFLKQMSIKQFVFIINYFLKFISGNRFTVGTNHVEDIFNILQKLNYPYPINKSWLKTPTTLNAFGNVIVLYDFFMNFVPNDNDFELAELEDNTMANESELEPDLEFKSFLIENCYESFKLWDRQLNEELEKMKRIIADLLIRKRGFEGLSNMEEEIKGFQASLNEMQTKRPNIDPKEENKYEDLREHVKMARKELDQIIDNYDEIKHNLQEVEQKKKQISDKCLQLEQRNAELQAKIEKQTCTVSEKNAYVEKIKLLRIEMESNARTMEDLQLREHNKKIELSNIKKKVTDEIESINSNLRDLFDILGISKNQDKLQISLNADPQDIKHLASQVKNIRYKIEPKLFEIKEQLETFENEIKEQFFIKKSTLEPDYQLKKEKLNSILKIIETFEQRAIEESTNFFTKNQLLDDQIKQYEMEIDDFKVKLDETKKSLKKLDEENEENIIKLEKAHKSLMAARRAYLNEATNDLKECIDALNELDRFLENKNDLPLFNGLEKENENPNT